jgi:hypothetical protein
MLQFAFAVELAPRRCLFVAPTERARRAHPTANLVFIVIIELFRYS